MPRICVPPPYAVAPAPQLTSVAFPWYLSSGPAGPLVRRIQTKEVAAVALSLRGLCPVGWDQEVDMSPFWDPVGLDPESLNCERKKHKLPERGSSDSVHSHLLLDTQARESHLLTIKPHILAAGGWQLPEG